MYRWQNVAEFIKIEKKNVKFAKESIFQEIVD